MSRRKETSKAKAMTDPQSPSATPALTGIKPPGIVERLKRCDPELTARERRAAAHLRLHFPAAGLGAMAHFARSAHVSPQTVLRLLAKLGFASWQQLQDQLRVELAAEQLSPLGRWRVGHAARRRDAGWLAGFGERLARNVADSFADLAPAEFEAIAKAVADPKHRVMLIGGRFTQPIARLLQRHLQIVRDGVEEVGGASGSWPDRLIDAGPGTVLIAYDIRRYSDDVIRFASLASSHGARVIAMTDSPRAPILQHASHRMIAAIDTAGTWDSLTSLLAVTEALAARVTELSGARTAERLSRLETLRDRFFTS